MNKLHIKAEDLLPGNQVSLEENLFKELRRHLRLPEKYSNEFIELNLPFLFLKEDQSAILWLEFIEQEFHIEIPDTAADLTFFSSVKNMADCIVRYS